MSKNPIEIPITIGEARNKAVDDSVEEALKALETKKVWHLTEVEMTYVYTDVKTGEVLKTDKTLSKAEAGHR